MMDDQYSVLDLKLEERRVRTPEQPGVRLEIEVLVVRVGDLLVDE